MTWVPGLFAGIESSLDLTKSQTERLERGKRLIDAFAATEQERGTVNGQPFLQGSISYGLMTRPPKPSREFDVDVVLPINLKAFSWWNGERDPNYILPYFAQRLRTYYNNHTPVQQHPRILSKNRCIRINYKGEFHLDLVPMAFKDDHVIIFDQASDERVRDNHPRAMQNYVDTLDAQFDGYFRRSVRLLRRWRDLHVGKASQPSSLALTVLAGQSLKRQWKTGTAYPIASRVSGRTNIDTQFTQLTLAIREYLENYPWPFTSRLPMPGQIAEDLDESWSDDARDRFQTKITTLSNRAHSAIQPTTKPTTAAITWRKVFE